VFAGAGPAAAQTEEAVVDRRALASAEIAATRLAGAWVSQAGGALSFRLGRRFEIGGAARVGLTTPTVLRGGSTARLHFGYAGARVTLLPAPERWSGLRVGVLLGGGNADVSDPGIGALVDSDNGAVIEPSTSYSRALTAKVAATAALSWRYAAGFRLIGGLRSRDLRGPSAGIAITVGPF
jgi:hypothetical protein